MLRWTDLQVWDQWIGDVQHCQHVWCWWLYDYDTILFVRNLDNRWSYIFRDLNCMIVTVLFFFFNLELITSYLGF